MKDDHVFTKTERDGKIALWVKMPNGENYNIWDLPKEVLTYNVEHAIISAFERGIEYQYNKIASINKYCFSTNNKFKEGIVTND